ncbi:MAG: phage integrase N-terminal SAM-like domain-containing protein [Bacteroidales bacterium]|jgi:integrase/recombinase XerD|nr:phage integrase N-terminal SAM-like domain-containing protein [Bacteroidales bacterium]
MKEKLFIEYLESHDITAHTTNCYIRYVKLFFDRVQAEAEQITKPDILKYLEHLKNNRKIQNSTRQHHLSALNHYFTFLQKGGQIEDNPCIFLKIRGIKRKTLYQIYTSEELEQIFDNYYQLFVLNYDDSHLPKHQREQIKLKMNRNAVILSILIYQGITTGELENLETSDIDLIKATIKIPATRQGNPRTLALKATQIGLCLVLKYVYTKK